MSSGTTPGVAKLGAMDSNCALDSGRVCAAEMLGVRVGRCCHPGWVEQGLGKASKGGYRRRYVRSERQAYDNVYLHRARGR